MSHGAVYARAFISGANLLVSKTNSYI